MMKTIFRITSIWILMMVISCTNSDLSKNYEAIQPKIIAVKIEDPEARPGDTVSMQLLVSGKEIDQNMTQEVLWLLAEDDSAEPVVLGSAPYNQMFFFQIPENMPVQEDRIDLTALAEIQVGGKYLNAKKTFRITESPVGKNPKIIEIEARYHSGGETVVKTLAFGGQISTDETVTSIGLTAVTVDPAEQGNDILIYQWYASSSKTNQKKIYIIEDKEVVEGLFGSGKEAAEYRESVVFSFIGEDRDIILQDGVYDIYIVVRDTAPNAKTPDEDRLGIDFFYVTLYVNQD